MEAIRKCFGYGLLQIIMQGKEHVREGLVTEGYLVLETYVNCLESVDQVTNRFDEKENIFF